MGIILGIFDSDVEYSSQLMNYIKRKNKNINQVRIFTNKNILYDFLLDNQINVLLISEDKIQEDIEHDNVGHICILSEGTYISEGGVDEGERIIYKYQSAEKIICELVNYYPELSNQKNTIPSNKSKIISIFSLNEDFVQETFSFNLANEFGNIKKTLLIDFCLLHGREQLSSFNSDKNLSEFIYFLKSKTPDILFKMNEHIQSLGSFKYLNGVMFGPDLFDLTTKDIEFWLGELYATDYEVIIFNVSCYIPIMLDLFRKSNELFLVTKGGMWKQNLYNNLIKQLNWSGYEDVIRKIITVEVDKRLSGTNDEYQINNIFTEEWGDLTGNYARNIG